MTSFRDGPAKGQSLMLKRAPTFLRVVEHAGKFDALDQHHDEPKPQETITVYLLVRKMGWIHIKATKGGGFFIRAEYEFWEEQPDEDTMRSQIAWRQWCIANNPGK